jgi:DNA ligase-associated metallophosphoesterase
MTAAPLHIAGERLMLDPAGCLHWPAQRLLVVSDLHFEKSTAAAVRGALLPPFDTRETLALLAAFVRKYAPRTIVALGDSFHDPRGAARLQAPDQQKLEAIAGSARFIWVLGNHDPAPPEGLPGESMEEFALGPLVLRHQAQRGRVMGEISGHFHPKASVAVRGAQVTRPCFVADGYRLMLPALGAYTGGLDVRDPAISEVFPRGGRVFLLGKERLYSFPIAPSRAGARLAGQGSPDPVLTKG